MNFIGRRSAYTPGLLQAALQGADVVLNSTRPGGFSARRIDETLPLALGMPTVGYSPAEFLHGPIAMFHPSDRAVLFSGADEPIDSKQAVADPVPRRSLGPHASAPANLQKITRTQ